MKAFRRQTWVWIALGVTIAALMLVRVSITGPRVHIRWQERVTAAERAMLERQYELRNGSPAGADNTWRYELGDRSRERLGALIQDPAVADTAYIDRDNLTSERGEVQVTARLYVAAV